MGEGEAAATREGQDTTGNDLGEGAAAPTGASETSRQGRNARDSIPFAFIQYESRVYMRTANTD